MSNQQLYNEWLAFHEANPQVYQEICRLAQQMIKRGRTRYAIGTIWEVMRWFRDIKPGNIEEFKLPNNHRAYYARLWLDDHPQNSGFFRLCRLRSEGGSRDRYGRAVDDNPDQPRFL